MSKPRVLRTIDEIVDCEGTITAPNAEYTVVGEWSDGNLDNEDRLGYFVTAVGTKMKKAESTSDVRGVTIEKPGFAANAKHDKYNLDGPLNSKYAYVCFAGYVNIRDDGTLQAGDRCMPDNEGKATKSSNNLGYQVVSRVDSTHVIIIVEPQGDMIQRIKTEFMNKFENLNSGLVKSDEKGNLYNLSDGDISTKLLANNSVTSAKLAPNAVTSDKLAGDAVKLVFSDVQVSSSAFSATNIYNEYPYSANIALSGAGANMMPEVIFGVPEIVSGIFSSFSNSYSGGVTIYASAIPSASITIPTIILWR